MDQFLNRGFSLACLHLFGNLDVAIDKLQFFFKEVANTFAPSFKKFPDRLSNPAALQGFILFNKFKIVCSVVGDNVKSFPSKLYFS